MNLRQILLPALAMAAIVLLSNVLVQYPLNAWLTWGAFSYPVAYLVTDVCNRVVGAALDLFEEVELWDALIVCLSLLGKKQQAADLVRRRLDADDRNPKLWCALGDALEDDDKAVCRRWRLHLANE